MATTSDTDNNHNNNNGADNEMKEEVEKWMRRTFTTFTTTTKTAITNCFAIHFPWEKRVDDDSSIGNGNNNNNSHNKFPYPKCQTTIFLLPKQTTKNSPAANAAVAQKKRMKKVGSGQKEDGKCICM